MSGTPSAGGAPGDPLQFDHAEFAGATPVVTCKVCGQGMHDVYYDVNGQPFCPNCRDQLQASLAGGSPTGRFMRASAFGSVAGAAGAVIYYIVTELTNINFGLISVLVGLMVGKAVKKGADSRGGWFYQSLAMVLTYLAIAATFIPPVIQAVRVNLAEEQGAPQVAQANQEEGALEKAGAEEEAAAVETIEEKEKRPLPSLPEFAWAVCVLLGIGLALPIMAGFDSPMGLIIIAIGLYEAWVINKRVPIVVKGPYRIGRAEGGGAAHVEPVG